MRIGFGLVVLGDSGKRNYFSGGTHITWEFSESLKLYIEQLLARTQSEKTHGGADWKETSSDL